MAGGGRMRINTNRPGRLYFLACAATAFAVGFFWAMLAGPRIYVLGITMLLMVTVYAAVELGWGGGSGSGEQDRWR